MNRGNARQQASGHGPGLAIADYDAAIELMAALRAELEPTGRWELGLRNAQAGAYMNRGNAKQHASGHGPGLAIADFDAAIGLMEALRAALEPTGRWEPGLRNDLAAAYVGRGNAKQDASGQGPGLAIADYDAAIALREALRAELEPTGRWETGLRNDLAAAYVGRGNAKQDASGQGPGLAIADYDAAIALREALRAEREPVGRWDMGLRNDLAKAYCNRGNAKLNAGGYGPAAAIGHYDAAIVLMETLRAELEPTGHWEPGLRNDLAVAWLNRGVARQMTGALAQALGDWQAAVALLKSLVHGGWLAAAVPLLRGQRWVFGAAKDLGDWPLAATTLLGFRNDFEGLQQTWEAIVAAQVPAGAAAPAPPWAAVVGPLVNALHGLDAAQRAALLAALGEDAAAIAGMLGW